MFTLIEVLNFEARQAFLGAVMDLQRSGRREVQNGDLAASLLRARSVAGALEKLHFDVEGLLARLAAPPPGAGVYDEMQRMADRADRGEDVDPTSVIDLPEQGRFMALPLSASARASFEAMRKSFAGSPDESITPRQVLVALLQSDRDLGDVCAAFGLRVEELERDDSGGAPG